MPNTYAEHIQKVDKTNYHKKHENMHLMELLHPLIVVFSSKLFNNDKIKWWQRPLPISFKMKGISVTNRNPGVRFCQNT